MAELTMKRFRRELGKLLDASYLEVDALIVYNAVGEGKEEGARLDTLKEIAELAGLHPIERNRCAYGGFRHHRGYL